MLLSHRCESHYLHFCISHLTFVISHLTHSPRNTLTEPMWDTVKRDLSRIVSNLKLVVFPNPNREDLGKALWDWDLWRPFCFIVFSGLSLTFTWSASVKKVIKILALELKVAPLLAFDLTHRTDSVRNINNTMRCSLIFVILSFMALYCLA
ncbi:hypothetical protein HA466_0077000 [Hirschfeldia incana]|nr:hypothetical protein HA466_0077000 [Hirschfeldia incana]